MQRRSKDNGRINSYGELLLDLCRQTGLRILNGRCGDDKTALTHTSRPYCVPTATLLRPGRSTVAMDAAGTQRGRSEEPKDVQGRRPSANILNMHKTVAETLHSC